MKSFPVYLFFIGQLLSFYICLASHLPEGDPNPPYSRSPPGQKISTSEKKESHKTLTPKSAKVDEIWHC